MDDVKLSQQLEKTKADIARKVHDLRRGRRWTQAELARRLDLSQSRLSEVERGDGSFTAEQFLTILRLFNVSVQGRCWTERRSGISEGEFARPRP